MAVAGTGDRAYLADRSMLHVIDVSAPAMPIVLGAVNSGWSYIEKVAIAGDHAYAAAGYGGVRVIDVSDATAPSMAGTFYAPGFAESVTVAGDFAYVAVTEGYEGLHVVDVSVPSTPAEVGSITIFGGATDVAVAGDYAYVVTTEPYWASGLHVIDVSNPAAPVETAFLESQAYSVTVAGDYAYVSGGEISIVDISNPVAPVAVGSYYPGFIIEDSAIVEDYAYGVGEDNLDIVDVSDRTSPVTAGFYHDLPGDIVDVTAIGDYAYLANYSDGLFILEYAYLPPIAYLPALVESWRPPATSQ
jgi:hypothetical protein